MSEIAMNAAHMIDMLPDPDKNLAYELIKKLVLAWDPDFTKLTTEEDQKVKPSSRKARPNAPGPAWVPMTQPIWRTRASFRPRFSCR